MFIPYEKLGNIIYKYYKSEKLKNFFYSKKVAQNLRFIKKNKTKVLQKLKLKSKNGEKIKIVFYVYDETKWKCQSVYDLLKKEPNFEVKILVTKNAAQNIDNPSYQTDEEIIKTYDFFKKHNSLNRVYISFFRSINYGINHFTEKNYNMLANEIHKLLLNKPEIKIGTNCFVANNAEFTINRDVFDRVKLLFNIN